MILSFATSRSYYLRFSRCFIVLFFCLSGNNNNNNRNNNGLFSALLPSFRGATIMMAQATTIPCETNQDCVEGMSVSGSICVDGYCSNPFHYGGCLESLLPEHLARNQKKRICGSDDPPEALEKGYCRLSPFQNTYMEIRILSQDWESSWFITWILQIVLSEILQVPVSIEGNARGVNNDFYNIHARTEFDLNFNHDTQILEGSKGDCRRLRHLNYGSEIDDDEYNYEVLDEQLLSGEEDEDAYISCAHVVPENWYEDSGVIAGMETPRRELGALGTNHIFIPKYTMQRDPSLVTYTGLGGEENRRKVAAAFKRPTTWKDYCEQVSEDNCQTPTNATSRPPENEVEEASYFVEGLYTGHFRATEENDCDLHPDTCTGNIVDFPCGWGAHTLQQMHYLNIALKGSGSDPVGSYGTADSPQIWAAANATKSDVIMVWWTPDSVYDKYIGTEAEMTHVLFPPATQECINNRAPVHSRCTNDYETNIGGPLGVCDYDSQFLKKVVSETLYELTHDPDIPEALWSPAYDFLANYAFSHLQIGGIFSNISKQEKDMGDFGYRDAVCRFVVDNLDLIQSYVPPTYPRVMDQEKGHHLPLFRSALVISGFALSLAVLTIGCTWSLRKTAAIYYTQTEFLYPVLLGFIFVSLAAWLLTIPPTNAVCVAIPWFLNIGYVLQLVPIVLRMYSINTLSYECTNGLIPHVRIKAKSIFKYIMVGCFGVGAYLLAWTLVDPLRKTYQYDVTDEVNEWGETIVAVYDACSSENEYWMWISYIWMGFLLLLGTVLALVTGKIREDLNDTYAMSMLIFIHIFFMILRISAWALFGASETQLSNFMGYLSLILSADTIFSIACYMLPKFIFRGNFEEKERAPDLFVNASIMVADVTGFTAWSSVREPTHVFTFLEELYETLDTVAEKHNVYKVETVREQYVAATGIPDAQSDHAIVIVKFAGDCIKKMDQLVRHLEVKYGPDTADMNLRIGINSGPVTGGYTKGKGGRFQLFGDTMTITSLIHSYSEEGRIHISDKTADLLIKAGKRRWLRPRNSPVHTTSKGQVQTYWYTKGVISPDSRVDTSSARSSKEDDSVDSGTTSLSECGDDSERRWIDFNVEVLKKHLKNILRRREARRKASMDGFEFENLQREKKDTIPLDEVVEIIPLPNFDKKVARRQRDVEDVELDVAVVNELKDYVTIISKMYNKNAFHNFAHASYVVMAIQKYLNRINAAHEIHLDEAERDRSSAQATLHEHTYGITSDPLTQFACIFSALIHDVDHPGVPNQRLVVEKEQVVTLYRGRSVAEQKSFDLAWDVLMEKNFDRLRATICADRDEVLRFRQLVINSVMATDLGDRELKDLRNRRWQKAFKDDGSNEEESERDIRNRKATIVIEHLIQMADVAHMCQHWNIYRKWNQRFFDECYKAYLDGRADKNPAEGWYEGEMGFYDFYIIPLAEKLRDCGVFGPTSDENLNYARNNRELWGKEGKEIVAEMLKQAEARTRGEIVARSEMKKDFV